MNARVCMHMPIVTWVERSALARNTGRLRCKPARAFCVDGGKNAKAFVLFVDNIFKSIIVLIIKTLVVENEMWL